MSAELLQRRSLRNSADESTSPSLRIVVAGRLGLDEKERRGLGVGGGGEEDRLWLRIRFRRASRTGRVGGFGVRLEIDSRRGFFSFQKGKGTAIAAPARECP